MHGFNIFGFEVNTYYTEVLAKYMAGLKFEDLPKEAVEQAKLITLRILGGALEASGTAPAAAAERIAWDISTQGTATSWVSGKRMSASAAAFVNGTAGGILDWADSGYTGSCDAALVAAAAAIAEETGVSGREYLTALVGAYECWQRIALCVDDPAREKDPARGSSNPGSPIFAAALAAGKMLGLRAEKLNQDMGMCVLFHKQFTNLQQATLSDGGHFEDGWCAQGGVQAAECIKDEAINNMTDCLDLPYSYLEPQNDAPAVEWLNRDLGGRWFISERLTKRWPAHQWLQRPLDIAYKLVKDNGIDVGKIASITVGPAAAYHMDCRSEGWDTIAAASSSLPYCMAVSLLGKVPGIDWYVEENRRDPAVIALAGKIRGDGNAVGAETLAAQFLAAEARELPACTVTITMEDGAACCGSCGERLDSAACVQETFRRQAETVLGAEKAGKLSELVMDMEHAADLKSLGGLLARA